MRSKTKKNRASQSSSKRKSRKSFVPPIAGEAIAAGGFGCVFRPPVKCNLKSREDRQKSKNYITKIMTNRYATDEMTEVSRFLPIIKTISGYKNYFLLDDIFMCAPAPLTSSDKKNFNSKCNNLLRMNITADNINNSSNLSKLSMLNIPDGGIAVSKVMQSIAPRLVRGDKEQRILFGHLNNSMIRTLKNAIVPMNKKGIIHCDIKGDNMLVDKDKLSRGEPYVKIIDWGLGDKFNPSSIVIPDAVKNRPIQFNAPFGVILFDKNIINTAANAISLIHAGDSIYKILAYKIIEKSNDSGAGHTGYLTQYLLPEISQPFINFDRDDQPDGFVGTGRAIKNTLFANGIIVTHIQKILEKYYDPSIGHHGQFDDHKYFNEVYRWNVDVWGFLMGYIDLLTKSAQNSYSKYRENSSLQMLANIIYKYCLSGNYAAEKIPVDELEKELEAVSKSIRGFKSKGIIEDIELKPVKKPAKKQTKKVKKKIKLKISTESPKGSLISLPRGKKRCPTGYTKDAATGKCRKKGTKKAAKKEKRVAKKAKKTKKVLKNLGTDELFDPNFRIYNSGRFRGLIARDKTRKRCPRGFEKVKEHGGYLVCAKK